MSSVEPSVVFLVGELLVVDLDVDRGGEAPPLFSFSYMPFLESFSSDLERATRAACKTERCGVRFRITPRRVGCADFARETKESKINTDQRLLRPPSKSGWTSRQMDSSTQDDSLARPDPDVIQRVSFSSGKGRAS